MDYKRKSREVNLLKKEASHQRDKYLKYKKLNKALSKKKTPVILDDPLEIYSSSSSEADNSPDEGEKPASPTTQSWITVMKAATELSTPRKKSEIMVAEMDLSSINKTIVNLI